MPTYHSKFEANLELLLLSLPFNAAYTHLDMDATVTFAANPNFKRLFVKSCEDLCSFFGRQSLDAQHGEGASERLFRVFIYYADYEKVAFLHKSHHTLVYLCNRARDIVQFLVELSLQFFPLGTRAWRVRTLQLDGFDSGAFYNSIGHARMCYLLTLLSLFAVEQKSDLNVRLTRYSLSEQYQNGQEPSEENIHALDGNAEVKSAEYALEYISLSLSKIRKASEKCVFKSRNEADRFVIDFVTHVAMSVGTLFKLVRRHGLLDPQAQRLALALLRVSKLTTGRICPAGSPEGDYEDHTARHFHDLLLDLASIIKHGVMSDSFLGSGALDLESFRTGNKNVLNFLQLPPALVLQLCDSAVLNVDAVSIRAGSASQTIHYARSDLHCCDCAGMDQPISLDAYAPALYAAPELQHDAQAGEKKDCQDPVEMFLL